MNVVYDISLLGASRMDVRARTGIFRAVERLAYGLAGSPGCRLAFTAGLYLLESAAYMNSDPVLGRLPLLGRRAAGRVMRRLADLNARIDGAPSVPSRELLLRGCRSLLYRSARAAGVLACGEGAVVPGHADVFHSPFYALPAPTPQARSRKRVQRFLTIYDLTPLLFPELFALGEDRLLRDILDSLSPDDWVLCISEASKRDLCDTLAIDPSRIFVTPLAAESRLFHPCADTERGRRVREQYGIPEAPYILSLGTLQPRKNIDHLVRCFGWMVQEDRTNDLYLVLVGTKGWQEGPIFDEIEKLGSLRGRVIVTGYVADEDLAPLYSGAMAFVYPSFYEGFGLPPLEAMQCGVPVITSNTSSLPEVVGDAGIMLDPRDADGLCQSLLDLYHDASRREEMACRSLERAKQFNWERFTSQTIAAYRTALSHSSG